jgi:hypothetical protein
MTSRAEKYKELRERITNDNEKTISTADLKQYELRINEINPGILSPFSMPSSEDTAYETSQYTYRPFGSIPAQAESKRLEFITAPHTAELPTETVSSSKRSVTYPTLPEIPGRSANGIADDVESGWRFSPTDSGAYPQEDTNSLTKTEKQQKKESIRNEMDKMLREDTDTKSQEKQEYVDHDQTASLIHETQQLRQEMLEYADGLIDVDDRLKGTHKMISITLWIVILALVIIVFTVYFMVFKMRYAI